MTQVGTSRKTDSTTIAIAAVAAAGAVFMELEKDPKKADSIIPRMEDIFPRAASNTQQTYFVGGSSASGINQIAQPERQGPPSYVLEAEAAMLLSRGGLDQSQMETFGGVEERPNASEKTQCRAREDISEWRKLVNEEKRKRKQTLQRGQVTGNSL